MKNRKNLIKENYKQTDSYVETAKIFGISKQRVHQIITGYRPHRIGKKKKRQFKNKLCAICKKAPPEVFHKKDFDSNNVDVSNLQHVCKKCNHLLYKKRRQEMGVGYKGINYGFKCKLCKRSFKKHGRVGFYCVRCSFGIRIHGESYRPLKKYKECVECRVLFNDKIKHRCHGLCERCYAKRQYRLRIDYYKKYWKERYKTHKKEIDAYNRKYYYAHKGEL